MVALDDGVHLRGLAHQALVALLVKLERACHVLLLLLLLRLARTQPAQAIHLLVWRSQSGAHLVRHGHPTVIPPAMHCKDFCSLSALKYNPSHMLCPGKCRTRIFKHGLPEVAHESTSAGSHTMHKPCCRCLPCSGPAHKGALGHAL